MAAAHADLDAVRMAEPSALVPWSDAARAYAAPSFGAGRAWLDTVEDLMHRIHREFEFEPGATTVTTSVDEVLELKSGVCQDFAHVMIACLRSHGLAGALRLGLSAHRPAAGPAAPARRRRLARLGRGVLAAHGWVELDPTNDHLADRRYITLATGADFADVVPLRGVILGGRGQTMKVAVSVIPR